MMTRKLDNDTARYKQQKEAKITELQQSANTIRYNIRSFKEQLQQTTFPKQRELLLKQIIRQEQALASILGRLKNAGYTEKRGRPKKEPEHSYKGSRIKFTAHLLPEQLHYMKQLQADGHIDNISAFLNTLIAEHQKKNG